MAQQTELRGKHLCWNYSFADRKPCPAGKRGNYGPSKLSVQQTLYGRQSRLTDGKTSLQAVAMEG